MASAQPSHWVRVTDRTAISEAEMAGFTIEGRAIGIYNIGGNFYALEDTCPHAWVLLSGGTFDGRVIECPIHAARFNVVTGRRLSGPVCRDLRTYPIRIENDAILVDLELVPITRGR